MNSRIIIQGRTNSSRLPGKMILPFYGGKGLLELVVSRLAGFFGPEQCIVATTNQPADDSLVQISKNIGVEVFRGSENDVLSRFIGASVGADIIIRVCADNPFIQPDYIQPLIDAMGSSEWDYVSYAFPDGLPVIRSHIGLFAEAIKASALKKVSELTHDSLFREHVTNYIYAHPEYFKLRWLELPGIVRYRRDVRLTLDDREDFRDLKAIYAEVSGDLTIESILNAIDLKPEVLLGMKSRIEKYSK